MRILHVTEASASGTFEVVRSLAERLAADGHDVAVAAGRRPETAEDPASLFTADVEYIPFPWQRRTLLEQVSAARALRALVRRWRPDLVHLHSAFAGVVGVAALAHAGMPLVYTPHGSPLGRSSDGRLRIAAYRRIEAAVARRVALVGAVSQAEAALVTGVAPTARITVVPNGIAELDAGALPDVRTRTRARAVAFGRITRQRRPEETAHILRGLTPEAEVCWIGGGTPADIAPVRAAGVPITGWLPRVAAVEHLATATLLVHWSAWDGAALAVLEAMAHDVVVVGSDIPPNRELIGDAQVCDSVADAVQLGRAVLADPVLRLQLLQRQRARGARYGADGMATRWALEYRRVLGCAPAPAADAAEAPPRTMSWT
jgi:glycosyltransferase involved in cell wall biosynthesis